MQSVGMTVDEVEKNLKCFFKNCKDSQGGRRIRGYVTCTAGAVISSSTRTLNILLDTDAWMISHENDGR